MDPNRIVARIDDFWATSDRLVLRRFVPDDLDRVLEQELDPRVYRYERDEVSPEALVASLPMHLGRYGGRDGEWVGLPIVPHASPHMVGVLAFRIERAARGTVEIGYRLHPDAQGKGYMVEAARLLLDFLFGTCDVRKVVASCDAENEPSLRLLRKLGMRQEGVLREHSWFGGRWHDDVLFGILAREWRATRTQRASAGASA